MAAVDPNSRGDLFGGQPPDVVGGRVDLSEVDMWLGSSSFATQQPESGVGGGGGSTTDEPSQELAAAPAPTTTRSAPRGRRKLPRAGGGRYNISSSFSVLLTGCILGQFPLMYDNRVIANC